MLDGESPDYKVTQVADAALTATIGKLQQTREQPFSEIHRQAGIAVSEAPLEPKSERGLRPFSQLSAEKIGITSHSRVGARNFIEPFILGRGIASGDFNRDGWIDVAVASTDGFELFQNINGERFSQVELDIPVLKGKEGFVVAMVDMNNDGLLDFYVTTFAEGNYLVLNPAR